MGTESSGAKKWESSSFNGRLPTGALVTPTSLPLVERVVDPESQRSTGNAFMIDTSFLPMGPSEWNGMDQEYNTPGMLTITCR